MKTISILLVLAFLYYFKSKDDNGNNGPGSGDDMGDYTGGAAAF